MRNTPTHFISLPVISVTTGRATYWWLMAMSREGFINSPILSDIYYYWCRRMCGHYWTGTWCRTWSMSYVNYGPVSFKKSFRIHKSYLLCDLILCTLVNYYYNHPHLPHHQALALVEPTNQYCRTDFHKFTSFMPIFNYIAPSQWIAVIHNKRTLSLVRTPTPDEDNSVAVWWTRAG